MVRAAEMEAWPSAALSQGSPWRGLAGAASAAGFVVAGAYPGPGSQVGRRREAGDVVADLREDHLGGPRAHARDGHQEFDAAAKGRDLCVDPLIQPFLHGGAGVDTVEHRPGQERVVGGEVAGQCLDQGVGLAAHGALGQVRQDAWVAFAGDEGLQHRPAGNAQNVGDRDGQLDPGVLQELLQRLGLPGAFTDHLGAIAGQIPQLPDRLRG